MITVKYHNNTHHLPSETFRFKSGEISVKLLPSTVISELEKHTNLTINCYYTNDAELIELNAYVDTVSRLIKQHNSNSKIELNIPYFPGGRQDRVCNEGEAFTLKMYANFINYLDFTKVRVFDPHSEVTAAIINNIETVDNHKFFAECFYHIRKGEEFNTPYNSFVLISPDAGSNKKIYNLNKSLDMQLQVVRADKLRDVSTGKIIETTVYANDLTDKICIIVDDICSYGGTFMALAKALKEKNAKKIYLVTSHNEEVIDLDKMEASGITKFFTTNSKNYQSFYHESDSRIKILNIDSFI